MPVRRVRLFAQAMKRGLSARGRPSSSQMTEAAACGIALDQVSGAAVCKKLGRKPIGNRQNPRLHVENSAAPKGLVHYTHAAGYGPAHRWRTQ